VPLTGHNPSGKFTSEHIPPVSSEAGREAAPKGAASAFSLLSDDAGSIKGLAQIVFAAESPPPVGGAFEFLAGFPGPVDFPVLAHKASGATVLGTFAFMVHGTLLFPDCLGGDLLIVDEMSAVLGEKPCAGYLADVVRRFGSLPDSVAGDAAEPAVGTCFVVFLGGRARIGGNGYFLHASGHVWLFPPFRGLTSWAPPFSGLAGRVVRSRKGMFRHPEACSLSGLAHGQ